MEIKKPTYNWYAIYTKANAEKKLCESLEEIGIESYLPIRKVLKYWSDRKKWVEEPVFKSYIFVRVSHKEFFNVLNTHGAVKYVSFGGKAQTIPENQIESIKTLIENSENEVTLSYDRIKKGVAAEVIHGSLKGLKGEISQVFGQSRILIRLEVMNCSLLANISKDEIKVLDENTTISTK